ncbi:MAG: xanthine dehydrogenase family protein subunit M [Candidatus Cloacimonetes bacterium]|nr:xanthine dehydrogenase family protein subunit M [Candidatus Cloacimonadota bacterium]
MAIAHEFEYFRPDNLKEVLNLLKKYGDKARILAGGTDLTVYIKEGLEHPEAVIDIKQVRELKSVEVQTDGLYIGAKATFSDILSYREIKKNYLLLWESARSVASVGIRNRATLIGNICSAVPSLDSAPALLCYNAVVHLLGQRGERAIPITDWFVAPRITAKQPDEIVLGVNIPKPSGKQTGCYLKLGRYGGEDLAQAGLGVLYSERFGFRLAYCAVGPIPKRAEKIEKLLQGKTLTDALIEKAKDLVLSEISPITDIRSGKEYRMHMCQIMLQRGLLACVDRMNGKQVDTLRILGG